MAQPPPPDGDGYQYQHGGHFQAEAGPPHAWVQYVAPYAQQEQPQAAHYPHQQHQDQHPNHAPYAIYPPQQPQDPYLKPYPQLQQQQLPPGVASIVLPFGPVNEGDWQRDLYDCCAEPGGCGLCVFACCCPSCQYGLNVQMQGPSGVCHGSCVGACALHFALGGLLTAVAAVFGLPLCPPLAWITQWVSRRQLRDKYKLPATPCHDCLVSFFCNCCALAQENRELMIRLQHPLQPTTGMMSMMTTQQQQQQQQHNSNNFNPIAAPQVQMMHSGLQPPAMR
eukprot:jgi/Chlat1/3346/Chrsp23S03660